MYLYPHEVFEKLEATSSRLEKIAILEDQKTNKELMEVIRLALNPHIQFFIRKIPKYENKGRGVVTYQNVKNHLNKLSSRSVTGNRAIALLTALLEDTEKGVSDTIVRIIQKNLKCGVNRSTVNKVWPNLIPEFPVMLCESYSHKNLSNITFPAIIQEKADGMRVNIVTEGRKVTAFSRQGKVIDLLGNLDEEVLAIGNGQDIMIDGELLVVEKNERVLARKQGNGILNKAVKGTISEEEAACVRFVTWDILPRNAWITTEPYETGYASRFKYLENQVGLTVPKKIKTSQTKRVENMNEAQTFFKKMLLEGKEGAVLKNLNSPWVNKRSKDQVKMKVEALCELKVVALEEGHGKHEGKLGSFLCSSECGNMLVSVGSGLSDEQRKTFWETNMVGEIITVKYNDVIDNEKSDKKSLFLPIFIEQRLDKTKANTLEEIEKQLK